MRSHLRIFISILAATFSLFQLNSQTNVELETIRTRLFNTVYVPTSFDMGRCNPDGTFNTVVYPTVQPTDFTGEPRPHLFEMNTMANAYNTPGSQYKNEDLLKAFVNAWNWWYTFNPQDANWWYRSIGWPNSLIPSFILMADDMKTKYPDSYQTLLDYLLYEWTPEYYAASLSEPDGANTSDITYYTLAAAVTANIDSIIKQTCEVLTSLISIQTTPKSEGIHSDYSFSQHVGTGRQLYMGNYGKEYIGGIIKFLILTNNTSLEIPAEKMTIFENLFLEGVSWIAYRNIFDHHQHGRMVVGSDGYQKSLSCLGQLISLDTPQKSKLQELYSWMSRDNENNAENIQKGNRMYWRHDYMVHKGKNYFTSNRMSSTRVICSESMSGQGMNNYYTGSGINYLYLTGQEYLEIWDDMNWRRLPGLTAPQRPATTALPTVPPTSQRALNGSSFAGGVSDGLTGVSGFKYSKTHNTEVDLSANKSCFYFENYFVVLGNSIKSGKTDAPIATTVNQIKFKDNFIVDNNGTLTSVQQEQTLAPAVSDRAYINNIGYHFISNTKLNYEVKRVGASDLAWIAFNHGNQPTDDSYVYAVHPNVTLEELNNEITNQRYVVVSNTPTAQCVVDTVSKTAQAIFFTSGNVELPNGLGTIETNQAAAIQVKWGGDSVFVDVANPYCESRNLLSVSITISGLYEGGESTLTDESTNKTKITIQMPLAHMQGSTKSVGLKNKVTSGLNKVENGSLNKLQIIPNKVSRGAICYISNPNPNNESALVSLYGVDGSLIYENKMLPDAKNRFQLNTSDLTPNIYIVKCNSLSGKIIIE